MKPGEEGVKKKIKRKIFIPSSEWTFFYIERQRRKEKQAL